jgi:hypothetical protein
MNGETKLLERRLKGKGILIDLLRERIDELEQRNAALVRVCTTLIDAYIPSDERDKEGVMFDEPKVWDAYELATQFTVDYPAAAEGGDDG